MSVPLDEATGPSTWVIERVRVRGPLRWELDALGLVPGTAVRVLRRARGHLVIAVAEARYGLGDEVARGLLVRRG